MSFRALALALVIAITNAQTPTTPLFLWSNAQHFKGQNIRVNGAVSINEVNYALSGKQSVLDSYLKEGRSQPEVIFVFLEPELHTEQFSLLADAYADQPSGGAFSKLKGNMESYATSSLVIPYTKSQMNVGSSVVLELISRLSAGSSLIIAKAAGSSMLSEFDGKQDVQHMTLEQLQEVAKSKWELLNNGITDLVVVCFNSAAAHVSNVEEVKSSYASDDQYMDALLQNIKSNYLAIFGGDKLVERPQTDAYTHENVKRYDATYEQDTESDNTFWPSAMIEAVIVMIPFLAILFTGIFCTLDLQSDLKFDAERKNK